MRKVALYDPDRRILTHTKMVLEKTLAKVGHIEFNEIKDLQSSMIHNYDAIVMHGPEQDQFSMKWLNALVESFADPERIFHPVLIITPWSFADLNEALGYTIDQNWYYDVLHPDHLESLPIRLANLIRIHDHLKELRNYDRIVRDLSQKVHDLEQRIRTSP